MSNQQTLNQSVERTFQIIEILANSHVPMRLNDISKKTELPSPTVLRMLRTMEQLGYVNQDTITHQYSLNLKFAMIGASASAQLSIRDLARPAMKELSAITGEAICLAQEHNGEVLYIDVLDSVDSLLTITQYIGKRAPMHCTGVGKLFLQNYSREELQAFAANGLKKLTVNTITEFSFLEQEIEKVRACRYAFDNEECEIGARCIAAGIQDYSGKTAFAISVSGPITRMTNEKVYDLIPQLLIKASGISKALGSQS